MYRKPDDDPLYIDKRLNYSPSVTKQLPASIYNRRSSSLSSSKLAFDSVANVYEAALGLNIPQIILQQLQPTNGNDKETSSGSIILLA